MSVRRKREISPNPNRPEARLEAGNRGWSKFPRAIERPATLARCLAAKARKPAGPCSLPSEAAQGRKTSRFPF